MTKDNKVSPEEYYKTTVSSGVAEAHLVAVDALVNNRSTLQRLRERVEKLNVADKKGIMEVVFGDVRKERIRGCSNMAVGNNEAIKTVLTLIDEEIKKVSN